MANRYLVGTGARNWSDGSIWSDQSNGSGGFSVPTSGDTVYFDNNSGAGVLTLDVAANCGSLNSSGLTLIVTITSAVYSMNLYGDLTENGIYSLYNFTGTAYMYQKGTGTITTNGRSTHTWNKWYIDGVGITVTNQDDFTFGLNYGINIYHNNGTWNTNNRNITCYSAYLLNGSVIGGVVLNAGSSNIYFKSGIYNYSTDVSFVLNAGTSTFTLGGSYLAGSGKIFYNIIWSQASMNGLTWGNFTCNNLTIQGQSLSMYGVALYNNVIVNNNLTISGSNSTTYRASIQSNLIGTQRTIACYGTTNITNCDFQDIILAGTANRDFSAQSDVGNCGGNSGITFPASVTQYFKHTSGSINWSNSTKWFTATNGGGSGGRVPLPQDSAILDSNSFSGASTLNFDCIKLGYNIDLSTVSVTLNLSVASSAFGLNVYGNCNLSSTLQIANSPVLNLMGRNGTFAFYPSSAGLYSLYDLQISAVNSTINLMGDLSVYRNIALNNGTFNANSYNISAIGGSAGYLNAASGTILNMGSGTWSIYGIYTLITINASCVFNSQTSTIIFLSPFGSGNTLIAGGGKIFNNVRFSNGGTFTGTFDITGSNSFNNITIDTGRKVRITAGTTQTVNSLTAVGTALNPITISSTTTGSTYTIINPNTSYVSKYYTDYLNVSDCNFPSTGMWYTGQNSTNINNTGIIFDNYNFMVCKYSNTTEPYTIKVNNMVFGSENVGYGPTSSTGFWNCIDTPASGYTIYYYSSGMTQPSIVIAHNDTEAIYWAKAYGGTNINTIGDALLYFRTYSNTAAFNINHPGIITDGLIINLDAGMIASYPRTGSTWYDLCGNEPTTNLLTQPLSFSTNYTRESWSGTITDNYALAPDGTMTATLVSRTAGYFYKRNTTVPTFTILTGDTLTFSCWVKKNDATDTANKGIVIWCYNGSAVRSVSTQPINNNTWTRLSTTYTALSGETDFSFSFAGAQSYAFGGSILIWHPQVEKKSYTTSFVYGSRGITNGTLVNGFSYDTTNYGNLIFDGISDYVTITPSYSHLSSSSIETVIYVSSFQPSGITSIGGYDVNNASTYSLSVAGMIYLDNSTHKINASVITQTQTYRVVTSSTIITTGKYYHIIFTKDTINGLMQLYINSISESSNTFDVATYSKWPSTGGVDVGSDIIKISHTLAANTSWDCKYLNGKIPIFRLYNRILSSTEVSQNYNAVKGRFGL